MRSTAAPARSAAVVVPLDNIGAGARPSSRRRHGRPQPARRGPLRPRAMTRSPCLLHGLLPASPQGPHELRHARRPHAVEEAKARPTRLLVVANRRLAALGETFACRPEQARAGPALGALASGRQRAQGRDVVSSRAPWMPVGPAPCFWRFAGRVCLWSRDLHRLGCGTRIGLAQHFPHRFDAGGCGVSARRPLRHV